MDSVAEQISKSLVKVEDDKRFASGSLWLTLYLMGPETALSYVAKHLQDGGWFNTSGSEGCFIYPKHETTRDSETILQIVYGAQQLAKSNGVELLEVALDTSADVLLSSFITLYYAP